MTIVYKSSVLLFSIFFFSTPLLAQLELEGNFPHKLKQVGLDFIYPVESDYKIRRIPNNTYQDYDFCISSRKEKLEIRYLVDLPKANSPFAWAPHIRSTQMATHLATNHEDGIITVQRIPEEQLLEDFNADWGKVYFFEPKTSFSNKSHCRMLALFKEDRGMAFVFFLFDEIKPSLDYRFYAIRYEELESIK